MHTLRSALRFLDIPRKRSAFCRKRRFLKSAEHIHSSKSGSPMYIFNIIIHNICSPVHAQKPWSTLYPLNMEYIISTQYGVHYIHSIWSTLYPLNMEYIISTQYGVHYIHSIWSTLYPLNMEYIISTQYGVHYIHSIWSTLYPLNMEYIISTQYVYLYVRMCT